MREKHMETSAGMLRGEQDLLKKDQSQSNVALGNVNQGVSGAVQSQAAFQIHQQQPRVSAVCWERYLPRRSLNVLLVESDDSTCHLVSALLRNCGYEVTAATDGLQAWNILVDLTTHIDLVLTEVDMPCLSGTSLLCKIMNHKTCRNIPVIMMSSHDPMVLVLKCLSKGAVDFLVKPVRKNELKNLWQHVWRKYHSANDSDSASESGIHMQKPGKVKNAEKSVNNTQRNNGNANVCIDLNGRDESDSGSRTQSSWIKREVEVDNPFPVSPQDEYVDLADSTCAQVVFPRGEAIVDDPVATTAEYLEDNRGLKGVSIFEATKHERQSAKSSCKQTCTKQDKTSALEPNKDNQQTKMEFMQLLTEVPVGELKEQTADLIGLIADGIVQNEPKASERQNKSVMELNDLSSFGLNLKRPREAGDGGGSSHADRNVLRRSEISSSSRYNGISTLNHVSTGRVGSTRVNNTSRTMRTESTNNFPYNSSGTPDKKWNDNCNKNGMGSITVDVLTTLPGSNVKSISTSKIQHVSSPSQPMQNNDTCPSQQMLPQKTVEARGEKQQVQVQHHHHHHHYYHHHMHETQEEQSAPYDEDMQVKNMTTASMQCGSSNVFSTVVEGSDKKYSSNESGSGSKHGSNLPNGSNADVNVGETDLKSENLVPGKTGDCYESQSENRRGVDTIPTEASLNKFTHKRKEKCFKNKVELKPRRS